MYGIEKKQTKSLKDALYDTIHKGSRSIAQLAESLDMGESYLYRAALPDPDTAGPNASGVRFPLKKVVPLVLLTGDTQVLDVLEWQVGRVAVPVPKAEKSLEILHKITLNAVVQFGDLMRELQMALSDNNITKSEKDMIEKEGREAIAAITQLLSTIG